MAADTAGIKAIVRDLIESHQRQDEDHVSQLLAADLVWHHGNTAAPLGREDWLRGMREGRRAFSDLRADTTLMLAEGNLVSVLLTIRGRHTGDFQGIAPTGQPIAFASMWIVRVETDRIAEVWALDEDIVSKLQGHAQAA
jgi:predicted ester cyclase